MLFLKRNSWAIFYGVCFICAIIASFSVSSGYLWFALVADLGTAGASWYCFLHPTPLRPFKKVYVHEDWDFAALDSGCPRLYIPATTHKIGRNPEVSFRQGDFVFPVKKDADGNVIIIRDNHSLGRFVNLGVIIREEEPTNGNY